MAASTASRALALTLGEPLITRDTVPRPTPARAATSSSVGLPPGRRSPFICPAPSPLLRLFCITGQTTTPDELGVPAGARLHRPPLGRVVHVDQAEPLAVPPGPLEVVHQGPDEVPLERHAGLDRPVAGAHVRLKEVAPPGVVHGAVLGDLVVEGGAVLRDVQREERVLGGEPGE